MLHFDETDAAVTSDGASVVIGVLDGHGGDHGRIASQVMGDAAEIMGDAAEISCEIQPRSCEMQPRSCEIQPR